MGDHSAPFIGLLTDFNKDYYQAVMKGIIYSHNPNTRIIDIPISTHFHTVSGAWTLYWTFKYFPPKTMFLVVVDPGVGTKRRILLAKIKDYLFLAPDNSILAPIIEEYKEEITLYEVFMPETKETSRTFHGRDIFAPIIGKLVQNYPQVFNDDFDFSEIGTRTYKYFKYEEEFIATIYTPGKVVYIDEFGNIVTNIRPPQDLPLQRRYFVNIPPIVARRMWVFETFEDGEEDRPFLILGSCNTFEIVMKKGSAAAYYKNYIEPGDLVSIME